MELEGATLESKPSRLPVKILDGCVLLKLDNMIDLPSEHRGEIELGLTTAENEHLRVRATHLHLVELGEPELIEEFDPPKENEE